MSLFSWFKSTPKAVDNVMDKENGLLVQLGSWVGNQQFTEQERAEFMGKAGDFALKTIGENSQRSIARRYVAILWIKAQLALVFLTIWAACLEYAVGKTELILANFIASFAFGTLMTGGTLAVIGFFFGPYMLGSHMNNGKSK